LKKFIFNIGENSTNFAYFCQMEKNLIPIGPAQYAKIKGITRQMACYSLRKYDEGKSDKPEGVERVEKIGSRWILYVNEPFFVKP
jgi:hypothetical protein